MSETLRVSSIHRHLGTDGRLTLRVRFLPAPGEVLPDSIFIGRPGGTDVVSVGSDGVERELPDAGRFGPFGEGWVHAQVREWSAFLEMIDVRCEAHKSGGGGSAILSISPGAVEGGMPRVIGWYPECVSCGYSIAGDTGVCHYCPDCGEDLCAACGGVEGSESLAQRD